MQFENSFTVDAPIDRVWAYLLDVHAVAPCLPGAELTEMVSDTEFKGSVKIKLGAMQVSYRGTVVLTEVDEGAHRVVMTATGSETRGTGGASGNVTSTLTAEGPDRTTVKLVSEVNVTGRVAQFGRNIMQDVSNKLIREFARCLEMSLASQQAGVATQESIETPEHVAEPARHGSSRVPEEERSETPASSGTESTPNRVEGGAPSREAESGTAPAHGSAPRPSSQLPTARVQGKSEPSHAEGSAGRPGEATSRSEAAANEPLSPPLDLEAETTDAPGVGTATGVGGAQGGGATPPPTQSRPFAPSAATPATEIRVLPLVVDVARTRLARGLRSLARFLDPDK